MAGRIGEAVASRKFTVGLRDSSRELLYTVMDTDDEAEVQTLLLATAPAAYLGLLLESIEAEPVDDGVWKCTAKYVRLEDENEYTFETGGGTTHITQGLGTVNAYAVSGFTAPNFQGAIGVSDDKVEGVDIPTPRFEFSETHVIDNAIMTAGYKQVIRDLTSTVNNGNFKGHAAGECLFLGASGQKRGNSFWSVTFRFSAIQNVTGLTIGDITGIDKDGWDYLWVRYAAFEHSAAVAIVQRPIAVYVERVLNRADFSTLLIGT